MSCNNTNPFIVFQTQFSQSNCNQCGDPSCGSCLDSKCVHYTGAALPCSGIITGETLEVALQKIDAQICAVTGDYSTYNTACLAPITTQQQFVEAISSGYCTLLSNFNTFVNTTYVAYQTAVDVRFDAIEVPGITCAVAGVIPADSLQTVLNKYCTEFGVIDAALNISTVDWDQCFTVVTPPTTLAGAFDLLIDQICTVASGGGPALPVFNNVGSCLPTPGASDSLVDTVNKIKTRLCQTGTFDINSLTWGCVVQPSVVATDLQAAMQAVLTQVDDYIKNKLTFSGDFVVALTNPLNVCLGKTVSLTTPIVGTDRLVAATAGDLAPGTLQAKLVAGTDIALDFITVPGTCIINSTGSFADTYRVKASTTDTTPNFLDQKINGVANGFDGITITEAYNGGTEQLDLTPSISWATFLNKWFNEVEADVVAKIRFCTLVQGCIDENFVCVGYTVSLTPAQILANASGSFSFTDCNNNVQVVNLIAPGFTTVDICALRNSISALGLIVIDNGACIGNTTTTTTSTTTTSTTSTTSTSTTTTTTTAGTFVPGVRGCSGVLCSSCLSSIVLVYTTTGTIFVGATLFSDAGLTTPYLGLDAIYDAAGTGVTFGVNPLTGAVLSPTVLQCV